MTEEELKQTWCPHVRAVAGVHSGRTAANKWPNGDVPNFGTDNSCIGRACSQFRIAPYFIGPLGPERAYCGLAGRPDEYVDDDRCGGIVT